MLDGEREMKVELNVSRRPWWGFECVPDAINISPISLQTILTNDGWDFLERRRKVVVVAKCGSPVVAHKRIMIIRYYIWLVTRKTKEQWWWLDDDSSIPFRDPTPLVILNFARKNNKAKDQECEHGRNNNINWITEKRRRCIIWNRFSSCWQIEGDLLACHIGEIWFIMNFFLSRIELPQKEALNIPLRCPWARVGLNHRNHFRFSLEFLRVELFYGLHRNSFVSSF